MMNSNVAHHGRWLAIAAVCVGMAACGGGSGSSTATGSSSATSSGAGTATSTGSTPVASSTKGVFTGYTPSGTDNIGGDGGGGGTGGDGGGDGGFGVGGSLGRIQGATVIVTLADGTELGRAAVDAQGMVTVKPGTDYTGPLLVEMRGSDGAAYYDEARQSNLPYTEPDSLRMALSKPSSGLVVVTPLTNAAVRLLETQVGSSALLSSDAAITSANQTVVDQINSVLPDKLKIASIIGPATLVDSTTPANSLGTTAADLYARALAALAEATNLFNPGIAKPAAAFSESFGNDMTDGIVNGVDAANEPIGGDAGLGYDVGTLASNLQTGAAIADQRYSTPAVAVTPAPTAAICPATYDQGGAQQIPATFSSLLTIAPAAGSTTPTVFKCDYVTSAGASLIGFEIQTGGYDATTLASVCGAPGEVSVINAQFDASRDFPFVLSTRRQIVVTAGFPNTLDVVTGVLQAAVAQGVGTPCP